MEILNNIFLEYTKIVPEGFFLNISSFIILAIMFGAFVKNWTNKNE